MGRSWRGFHPGTPLGGHEEALPNMAIETASSAALQCQGCGAPLEASRVDVKTGLASCASCNRVFKLAGETALVALPPRPAPRVIPDAFDTPTATSAPSDGYRGSQIGRAHV
jgi:ribosomal protein L37AE/L43A